MLLALSIAACYLQVSSHEFVWDSVHIFQQQQLQQFTFTNIAWIFTHPIIANWHPVSWLSHMLDFYFYGWNAAGHHLTNVLLHFINSCLVYLLVKQLLIKHFLFEHPSPQSKALAEPGIFWVAALSAIIFAVHPLRVESVAWVAERKDLLYSLFTLVSVMAYLRYVDSETRQQKRNFYLLSIILFVLALLSKSMAVTLPAVLLVLDWYPLRRFTFTGVKKLPIAKALLIEKIPFMLLSIIIVVVTLMTQADAMSSSVFGVIQQFKNAIHNVTLYLYNFMTPVNLTLFYPFPTLEEVDAWNYWLPSLLIIILISAISLFLANKKQPLLLTCWLLYLVMLSPASGAIHVGSAASADRYTYLTLLPINVLVAIAIVQAATNMHKLRLLVGALTLFALLTLGLLTHVQVQFWANPISLWSRVIQLYPNAALAHRNLSAGYNQLGDYSSALKHLRFLADNGWPVDKELAGTLAMLDQRPEAIRIFKRMLKSGQYSDAEQSLFRQQIAELQSR